MRLSDSERQDALDVLSEHVRTGRLDIDEFGERSAKVTAARMVSELVPLFEDLPSPRPSVLVAGAAAPSLPSVSGGGNPLTRWAMDHAVALSIVLALAIFLLTRGRVLFIFALPLVVGLFSGMRRRGT